MSPTVETTPAQPQPSVAQPQQFSHKPPQSEIPPVIEEEASINGGPSQLNLDPSEVYENRRGNDGGDIQIAEMPLAI